jgi:hypothetical protein
MAEATAGTVFLDGSAVLLGSKDDGSYLEVKDDIIIDSQGLFKVEAQAGVNISADSVSIVSDELNLIADSNTGIVNISAFDVVITANNTTGQILFDAKEIAFGLGAGDVAGSIAVFSEEFIEFNVPVSATMATFDTLNTSGLMNSTSELSIVAKSLGVADTDQGNITILAEKDVYADAGGAVRIVSSGNYGSATNSNLDRKTTDSGIQLLSDSSIVLRSKNGPGITTDFFGIKEFQDSGDYGEDGIYKEHSSIYVLSSQNVRIMAEATAGTVFLDGSAVLLGSKDDGSYLEVLDNELNLSASMVDGSLDLSAFEINLGADTSAGKVTITGSDVLISANNTDGKILLNAKDVVLGSLANQSVVSFLGTTVRVNLNNGSSNFTKELQKTGTNAGRINGTTTDFNDALYGDSGLEFQTGNQRYFAENPSKAASGYGITFSHAQSSTEASDGVLNLALHNAAINNQNNYIGFSDADSNLIGAISGHSAEVMGVAQTGIKLESAGADYAEYLEKVNTSDTFKAGDVVGVYQGKISAKTIGADRVMVVSSMPLIIGNKKPNRNKNHFEAIAFVGQVPVTVKGVVKSGDYIIASGANDKVAIAVSPSALKASQLSLIIGKAWSDSSDAGVKMINVGITPFDMPSQVIETLDKKFETLEKQNQDLQRQLNEIKALLKKR